MPNKLVKKDFEIAILNSVPLKDRFKQIGIDEKRFYREIGFAIQICDRTKDIEKIDPTSIFQSVYNAASIDLTLNPVQNLAYLIPRWNKVKGCMVMECVPGYQGLIKLLIDGGGVDKCEAYPVYKEEVFEYELGTNPKIKHIPDPFKKTADKILDGFYAVGTLPNGDKMIEVMSIDEIEAIRDNSDSYQAYKAGKIKSCVWVEFPVEMGRKTVLKRLSKYLPKGTNHEKVSEAIALDNNDYIVLDYEPLGDRIMQLAEKYCDDREYNHLKAKFAEGVPHAEALELLQGLIDRVPDPVTHGAHNDAYVSQKDIVKHLEKIDRED